MALIKQLRSEKSQDSMILFVGVILAAMLRLALIEYESGDFIGFYGVWLDFIQEHGGFLALKYPFSQYAPIYQYLLVIASQLFARLPDIYAIKLISIPFDFINAIFVYKIVRIGYPKGSAPLVACLAVLFAPTVVLNSALWGQADMVYTSCLVACLYFLLVKKESTAFIVFGLAVSFKLQAFFLLPLLIILALRRVVSWKSFLIIPLVYVVTIIPAWLVGRPINELLLVYVDQSEVYHELTMNAANLYQWFPNELYDILVPVGLIYTTAMTFFFVAGVSRYVRQFSAKLIIELATISVLILPYFLPKMHDRYFFPADVFSIILAFFFPSLFYIPIIVGLVSLFSYFPFLFVSEPIPQEYLALVLLLVIVILVRHLFIEVRCLSEDQAGDPEN